MKDLKITSFATILKPYGTIIFLPAIYSVCAYTDNQPWKHRAKHMLLHRGAGQRMTSS